MSRRAAVTFIAGGEKKRVELSETTTVGRDADCGVLLADRTVSRRHAVLVPSENGWLLRDLKSGNGTFVSGERVAESPLAGGETLRFGDVEVRFEELSPPQGDEPGLVERTLSQSLSIQRARRTRPVAGVVATVAGFGLLLGVSLTQRRCLGLGGVRSSASPARPSPPIGRSLPPGS